ncbi:MAG TPA: alpha/beta hydrolase [Burkholderiales bacterium]|nr:alpha/beta hydrolase [Burkholderiales bacterium]
MADARGATPPVVIETGPAPSASVIWLHGLGADGHNFEPIVPQLALPARPSIRFVFPHAPFRPVTWNNGYVMRAWYDIAMTERGFYQNLEHLREAETEVHRIIEAERARGIDPSRIVVAGFSQGGAVALHAGLRFPERLAGLLCLSMPAPYLDQLLGNIEPKNAGIPVFLAHGTQDGVVPFALGERANQALDAGGFDVAWHTYSMGHEVCPEEIRDISAWLRGALPRAAG